MNFGVAVKAKKLRFGWRARLIISFRGGLASSDSSSVFLLASCCGDGVGDAVLVEDALERATVSPDCELCASSTITAKRLPAVQRHLALLRWTKGNSEWSR